MEDDSCWQLEVVHGMKIRSVQYEGLKLVPHILSWCKEYCSSH